MVKWIVVMKIQPSICLDDWGKPRKTPVRLVGTGIWTRDLPNASLVRYHEAISLGRSHLFFSISIISSWLTLYSIPMMNFGVVRRAQLAKSLSSTPRWSPSDFKVCSDAKESGVRKATWSYRTYSIPGKTATLVLEFAVKRRAFGQNCNLGSWVCSERPALGPNTLIWWWWWWYTVYI